MDRHCASRIVRCVARCAGVDKPIGPHTLRHAFTAALDAGVPLRDVQEAASHADPAHHQALRPRPGLARPARHLHRSRLPRRRRPIDAPTPSGARTGAPLGTSRNAHGGLDMHDRAACGSPIWICLREGE